MNLTYQKLPNNYYKPYDIIKHDNGSIGYILSSNGLEIEERIYQVSYENGNLAEASHSELAKEFETKWSCQPSSEKDSFDDTDWNRPTLVKIWTNKMKFKDYNVILTWFHFNEETGEIYDKDNSSGCCESRFIYDTENEAKSEYKKWIKENLLTLERKKEFWNNEFKEV